ncbi:MAG: PadR family transcriptional regulator [Acidimicrobiales bacterium]|nr:MAG: PadR family transcriptional regulator [Acidimicrobiales bacterium]
MAENLRLTTTVAAVLAVFLEDPQAPHYGFDLTRATGQPSGTMYPILLRLERAGWLEAHWEEIDEAVAERPARRYYRLTPDGLATACSQVAALRKQLGRASKAQKEQVAW